MSVFEVVTCSKLVNSFGLILDIIGVVIIYNYGLPDEVRRGGKSYLLLEQDDPEEEKKAKKYDKISRVGLALLVIGFVLQIFSNFIQA